MQILGNRILVSKIEEEKKEGQFAVTELQDSFLYKGRVEQLGKLISFTQSDAALSKTISNGDIVLFAKYSPDTHELDHDGKKMKIINVEDVLAVL